MQRELQWHHSELSSSILVAARAGTVPAAVTGQANNESELANPP